MEVTSRYPLPVNFQLGWRNRVELRGIQGQGFSWRYRSRLELERSFSIGRYAFTPFVRGEAYYDSRYERFSKNAFSVGTDVPFTRHSSFELYYQDQRDSGTPPVFHTRGPGLTLNLFL